MAQCKRNNAQFGATCTENEKKKLSVCGRCVCVIQPRNIQHKSLGKCSAWNSKWSSTFICIKVAAAGTINKGEIEIRKIVKIRPEEMFQSAIGALIKHFPPKIATFIWQALCFHLDNLC